MSQLLPFMLFAFVASITPGPTNVLVLGHSARHGLLATLPLLLGACCGAAGVVLAVGLGLGEALQQFPQVQRLMAWLGVGWLSYLAWSLWRSAAEALQASESTAGRRPGLLIGAALQLVNPKTWMMALVVLSVFVTPGAQQSLRVALLSAVFLAIALPCMACWAMLGRGAARLFGAGQAMANFNRVMALLLLASAWLGVALS